MNCHNFIVLVIVESRKIIHVVILEENFSLSAEEPINPESHHQQLGVIFAGHNPEDEPSCYKDVHYNARYLSSYSKAKKQYF